MKSLDQMTNDEFFEFVVHNSLKGWVPLKTYLRLFAPEETKVAVELRVKRGHWKRGIHVTVPKGGNMWVNLIAIGEWLQSSADASRSH